MSCGGCTNQQLTGNQSQMPGGLGDNHDAIRLISNSSYMRDG